MLYEKGKPWSEKVSRSMEKEGKNEIMGKEKKWAISKRTNGNRQMAIEKMVI